MQGKIFCFFSRFFYNVIELCCYACYCIPCFFFSSPFCISIQFRWNFKRPEHMNSQKKRKKKMTGTCPGVHCQKYLLIIGSYSYTTRHTCIHTQACTLSTHLSSSSERTNLYILYWTPHHHLSSLSLPCHAPFPFPIHPYRHKHAHTHRDTHT